MILGIDEVGRGPWAGPLVMGAVVLDNAIEGLTDSKKLTKRRREELSSIILDQAVGYGLGWVSAEEIDEYGLSESLRLAARRAIEHIHVPYHEIIIDGTINFLEGTGKGPYVTTLKKADLLIASVSAASIIAKVARDDYMSQQSETYPEYGFAAHVGYGTTHHKAAMEKYGLTPLHRRSFKPVGVIAGMNTVQSALPAVTNKNIGEHAEMVAAEWLHTQGYAVIDRNWKTKFCEIDIVATRDNVLYFVEVKHRRTAEHGSGIDAITNRKYRQMEFAARIYTQYQKAYDKDVCLMVVTTVGTPAVYESSLQLREGA